MREEREEPTAFWQHQQQQRYAAMMVACFACVFSFTSTLHKPLLTIFKFLEAFKCNLELKWIFEIARIVQDNLFLFVIQRGVVKTKQNSSEFVVVGKVVVD